MSLTSLDTDRKNDYNTRQKIIDRLNTEQTGRSQVKMLSQFWYMAKAQRQTLYDISNSLLTPQGIKNSDEEIQNYNEVMDFLSQQLQKIKSQ